MSKNFICTTCGHVGVPITQTKGSIWIEIILWCLMILPGVLYSIWRLTTRAQVCPACKNPTMIPLDTPQGQALAGKFAKV